MGPDTAQRDATSGWGCSACLACINLCPAFAYECSMGERNPAVHFLNEEVTPAAIVKANCQL